MFLIKELKGLPKNFPVEGSETFRLLPYESKEFQGVPTEEMGREASLGWIHIMDLPEEAPIKKGGKA